MKIKSNEYTDSFLYGNRKMAMKITRLIFIGILAIYCYSLFAPSRLKILFSYNVDGSNTTNEIVIILFFFFITIFIGKNRYSTFQVNKTTLLFPIYIFLLFIIVFWGGFNIESISQFIYATLLFSSPILLFFIMLKFNIKYIVPLIKTIVLFSLIYAVVAITLTMNYSYWMEIVGNDIENYRNYSQYRASMMLGSSITVSYYFNLTLPICFYLYFNTQEVKWKYISGLATIAIIIATFILLSRIAVICTILIIIYSFIFIKGYNRRKAISTILIIIALIFTYKSFDLSRILNGTYLSGSSTEARFEAGSLGLRIFNMNPILGSGIGRYFERVYTNKFVTFDGVTGLIDPHNMYILILSELGLIGLILFVLLFINILKRFSNIKDNAFKHTAYLTLFVFLFDSIGGTHLFNEISYSAILWIHLGLFYLVSIRNINDVGELIEVGK